MSASTPPSFASATDGRRILAERLLLAASSEAHDRLQAKVLDDFLPRFAEGARVLCICDVDHRPRYLDGVALASLGVPVVKQRKLPDIVLYDALRRRLFLMEVAVSHGPVSSRRRIEIEKALSACELGQVYVSVFPGFNEFTKYASRIAWETVVWLAEAPAHMVHYNGGRILGPR
jgi:hypothetical protein